MAPILPTKKGLLMFPFFNMHVVNMKGWQLYVGQTVWVVAIGLFFYLLMLALNMTGIGKLPGVVKGVRATQSLMSGEGVGTSFAPRLLLE